MIISLDLVDEVIATCNSATISASTEVIAGAVDITFIATDGTAATTTLDEDANVTFEPATNTITNNGGNPFVVEVDGEQIPIDPGTSILSLTEMSISVWHIDVDR